MPSVRWPTRDPAVIKELEDELSSLSGAMQGRQMRLYDRVAEAQWGQGGGQARLDALSADLGGPPVRLHDLALFLALEQGAPVALDAQQLAGLTRQLRFVMSPSAGMRLAAARAYGRAGESPTAGALLQAALLQSLYPTRRDYADPGDPAPDAAAFLTVLAAFPDQGAARRIRGDLARLAQRQAASPAVMAPFAALASAAD